jgi:hypothetical protein
MVERFPGSADDLGSRLVAVLRRTRPKSGQRTENTESTESPGITAEPRAERPSGAMTPAED